MLCGRCAVAKGKYGARAANRLVQTDNELLKERIAECDRLKSQLAEANQEIHKLRTAAGSEAIRRANDIAADQVAHVRAECARQIEATETTFYQHGRYVAELMWRLFVGPERTGTLPRSFVTEAIPRLLPDDEVNEFINSRLDEGMNKGVSNRRVRRHGIENIQRRTKEKTDKEVTQLAVAAAYGSSTAREVLLRPDRLSGTALAVPHARPDEQEA